MPERSAPSLEQASAPVVVCLQHGVLEIVLNRPQARNAIGLSGAQSFLGAVARLADPPVRCLLVRAEGEDFCAGGDLRDFAAADDVRDRVLQTVSAAHAAVLALAGSPVPVVTAVQGWSAGIGVALAALGDVVVAGENAHFRSSYTAIGFTPDGGLTHLLPRLVGHARAGDFVLTNRVLDAAQALSWGLVSRVVPDGELLVTARLIARQLADGPRQAQAVTRTLLRSGELDQLRDALDAEAAAICAQAAGPEGRAGVAAFLQRQSPEASTA